MSLWDPDRRFVLTILFASAAVFFYAIDKPEAGAAFIGLTGAIGGAYAENIRIRKMSA